MKKKIKKIVLKIEIGNMQDYGFHPFTTIKINGKPARMLVDTGASFTCIAESSRRKFALGRTALKHNMSKGLGGSSGIQTFMCRIQKIELGKIKITNLPLSVIDITHINAIYDKYKLPKADGIIGADILLGYKTIIDLHKMQAKLTGRNMDFSHVEIKLPELPK